MRRIDLVWWGAGEPPAWTGGRTTTVPAGEWRRLAAHVTAFLGADAPASVLHWALPEPLPPLERLGALLDGPDDVWHAGLRLGLAGLPRALDHVAPTWRFSRDPDPEEEATSWRLSLSACLVRSDVVRVLGHASGVFDAGEAAGLDLGRRWLGGGALLRHVPWLTARSSNPVELSPTDELRLVRRHHGSKWALWAAGRMALTRSVPVPAAAWALARARSTPPQHVASPYCPPEPTRRHPGRVSVVIPTIERYPYLRVVLDQLRRQTVSPHQVVVVDQTPEIHRDHDIAGDFADLPLELILLDHAGQSTARNAGLERVTGDVVLFLDDDDEIDADLIERHLHVLGDDDIDASCGVAVEPGLWIPHEAQWRQASPVFPTNNTMLRTRALERSGLFDLAYDHGIRADGDLGMRLYLAGCRMVVNPSISVLHHRAPRGGLRQYSERTTTYAGTRSSTFERRKLAPTEVYLARRYFTPRQVQEMLVLHRWGTLARHGSPSRRVARAVVQLGRLRETNREIAAASLRADELFATYPRIPTFAPAGDQ